MQLTVIQTKIFEIRGQKVMLDFDLAELYQTETKYLKRSVRQNINRFPADFMFELTNDEFKSLRSQNVTSKKGGTRYMPFAFTEHGITMLSSILNSATAIEMNIAIVRAFIALKQIVMQHNNIAEQLQQLHDRLGEHDVQLAQIYDAIENLLEEKAVKKGWDDRQRIGFIK